jgi:hypothetical protein
MTDTALHPKAFGAVGNGVADDTAALQATYNAASYGETIDLCGFNYKVSTQVLAKAGVIMRGGKISWTTTGTLWGAIVAADDCKFDSITFVGSGSTGTVGTPLYQVGIFGGGSNHSSVAPASRVKVEKCYFSNMTVGVWVGGSSLDPISDDWLVQGNTFNNIVGFKGQSEGYGVLFSPATRCRALANLFSNISRHAIYLAGGATKACISNNVIDVCDNVGIQLNTSVFQPDTNTAIIANNKVMNITRTIAYGYPSSIPIGIFGKFSDLIIANNECFGFLDAGIKISASTSGGGTIIDGFDVVVEGNYIDTPALAVDGGIRIEAADGVSVNGNYVILNGAQYGLVIDAGAVAAVKSLSVMGNTFGALAGGSTLLRLAGSAARRVVFRNNDNAGFTTLLTDTTTAGTLLTDIPVPLARLPAAAVAGAGAEAYVNDLVGAAYVYGAAAVAGGARLGRVFSTGAAWLEG